MSQFRFGGSNFIPNARLVNTSEVEKQRLVILYLFSYPPLKPERELEVSYLQNHLDSITRDISQPQCMKMLLLELLFLLNKLEV
jgi:hypothetical protein